jgi:hypothetical protein
MIHTTPMELTSSDWDLRGVRQFAGVTLAFARAYYASATSSSFASTSSSTCAYSFSLLGAEDEDDDEDAHAHVDAHVDA